MESKLMFHFLVLITFSFLPFFIKAQQSGKVDCQEISLQADIIPACNSGVEGKIVNNGSTLPEASTDAQQVNNLGSGTYKIVIFDASGCYTELETEVN